jgi:hypothetical protein
MCIHAIGSLVRVALLERLPICPGVIMHVFAWVYSHGGKYANSGGLGLTGYCGV